VIPLFRYRGSTQDRPSIQVDSGFPFLSIEVKAAALGPLAATPGPSMNDLAFGLGLVTLTVLAACASPDAPALGSGGGNSSSRTFAGGGTDGDDDADKPAPTKTTSPPPASTTAPTTTTTSPPVPSPSTSPTTPPPSTSPATPPAPPFVITASGGHRMGDDDAVANSGTSVEQLGTLLVVDTLTHEVAVTATGATLDGIKNDISGNGSMTLTMPGTSKPGMYALVDGALFSPNANLALAPGTDLEHFPKGVVAYVNVTYTNDAYYASWASDIIWSGYELGQLVLGHVDRLKSPLVVDLGGNGVTFDAPRFVFDVDGDGHRDRIAWVTSSDTPFLVRDRNRNGRIDGIDEMFGDGTLDPNGVARSSKNGFEALARYDLDGNGVIDAKDPVFHELALWFDKNHDGITDPGELETLSARHMKQIALDYAAVDVHAAFGNRILQKGEAATTRGKVTVYDVWFRLD
jgi:hypothetical protein